MGTRVHLADGGGSFELPASWLSPDRIARRNVNVSTEDLSRIQTEDAGEWDREYAAIIDTVLPFDLCAGQFGEEGWGIDAHVFADLQLRVYVGSFRFEDTARAVGEGGLAAVRPRSSNQIVSVISSGGFSGIELSYDVWYWDYGGRASVEFYVLGSGERSVVFAFMHCPTERTKELIHEVLSSYQKEETKAAQPGATDNPDDAQRLRKDH